MRKALKIGGIVLGIFVILIASGYAWASSVAKAKLESSYASHAVDPPASLPPEELEEAVARGKHLVESRYVCIECHGRDFSGGVMVDDPAMGTLLGPNLTAGKGSKTVGFTFTDWDRIVRHGIRRDGRPAVMPSEDFVRMSDRELSDIIAYIGTFPPVDREVPEPRLGPLATLLMALGKMPLSADRVTDHHAPHASEPPAEAVSVEFGAHIAQVCTGCHRHNLEGGPIPVGPPDWAPAANLTPHTDGLAGWTFEQFETVMRKGRRADGTTLRTPMDLVPAYSGKLTDVEMRALWAYLQAASPVPLGK
jgi:mono/diheme cytochrome c family protein